MITGIDHVTILVSDLDAAIEQYKKILGTDDVRIGANTPGNGYRAAVLDLGGGQNIELITPTDETGPWARHLARHGDGIYLFCLKVDNVERTADELRGRGVRLPEPIRGLQVIHPSSAAGALVLMLER